MSDKELDQETQTTTDNPIDQNSEVETKTSKVEDDVEVSETPESNEEEATQESASASESESPDEPKEVSEKKPSEETPKKSHLWQVLVILAGLALVTILTTTGIVNVQNNNSASTLKAGEPVAKVNGVEISQGEYDQQLQQARMFLASVGGQNQGEEFDEELKGRILDDLVNAEILYQQAVEGGFEASNEEVEAEFETTKAQIGDDALFEAQLSTIGLSTETLKDVLKKQLTIEAYIESETNPEGAEIPEEDIQALYDQFFEGQEGAPSLEEVRPQIEAELKNQAAQEEISQLIDELRGDAQVEILI